MTMWQPAPTDFWDAPASLSALFVIDYALEVLTCALAAQHPGVLDTAALDPLDDPDQGDDGHAADRLATRIVAASDQLRRLLDAYREAVAPTDPDDPRR
jgi:hypothetical protein